MTFSFIFVYFIGVFVFFCRTSIITIKSVKKITSQIHLAEEKMEQLLSIYFAKILFQTVMMTVLPLSFWFYATINTNFSSVLFVSSGLFTVLWLTITGILVKFAYYIVTHKIKALKVFDYDKYFQNKEFFWTMCPMLYGILFCLYDPTIFPAIFAIVLGKYIWMDSFQLISLSNIKIKVIEFWKKSKMDMLLLLCQAAIMGFLLVKWYPIDDELIHRDYTVTFLLLANFLLPMLDMFVFQSIKSYAGLIITSRK